MKSPSTTISGVKRPTPCDVARAHLAQDVYNDSGAPAGWHRVGGPYENEKTGFYAQLYAPDGFEEELKLNPRQGPKMCPPALAFRGTDFDDFDWDIADWTLSPDKNSQEWLVVNMPTGPVSSKKVGLKIVGGDWVNNILQALGKMASQYGDAERTAEKVNNTIYGPYVWYTGHSLGGGLAASVGIKKNKDTVTFNSAGVHRNSVNGINPATARNCTNFWVTDEILTTLQENPSRLPLSRGIFTAAKKFIVTEYESFVDLPDAAGSKVNLRMKPIERDTITDPMEKHVASQANEYVRRAINQYGQGVLQGNPNSGGGLVGVPRFEPIPEVNAGMVEAYWGEVKAFYNEAIRRHKMDVVLSLMKAR